MIPSRHATASAAARLRALGPLLRLAFLAVPLLLLRAALSPRPRPLLGFSDRDLADIGLSRGDVERPRARPDAAELELSRMPDGRSRR